MLNVSTGCEIERLPRPVIEPLPKEPFSTHEGDEEGGAEDVEE
jgi:hypothetical protein